MTEHILQHLKRHVSPQCFHAYFQSLEVRIESGGMASVFTATRHERESIERYYKQEVFEAIRAVCPEVAAVQFCAAPRQTSPSFPLGAILINGNSAAMHNGAAHKGTPALHTGQGSPSPKRASSQAFQLCELPLAPMFKLAHFEHGICNKTACAAAQTIVETPGSVYGLLFLHGLHGLGKTHLLQGIGLGLQERDASARVIYTTCEVFANGYIAALAAQNVEAFRARFRSCHALLIDDVQFLAGKVKTQEELLYTIQYLRGMGRQVVCSANVPPTELGRLDPKLLEIFRAGLVVKLVAPEFELRVKLIHALAKRRDWTIDNGAACVLATHVEKSVGELEGALCKMIAIARADGVETSPELALQALRNLGHLRSGPLTLADVLEASAKFYSVKPDDIRSGKREAGIVHARHMAMHLAKHLTAHTVADIGRFFGNRDHTTVLHAIGKINGLLKREAPVQLEYQKVKQALGR